MNAPRPFARLLRARRLSPSIVAALACAAAHAVLHAGPGEKPLIRFDYAMHSTLGSVRLETETSAPSTETMFVPNRGFSPARRYSGKGPFHFRLVSEGDGGPTQSLEIPRSWTGKLVYFFVAKGPSAKQPVKLLPLPENPDHAGDGAIVFANYTERKIAAQLGAQTLGASPGEVFWRQAPNSPEGMKTMLVEVGQNRAEPIYRNAIPIRSSERLFIFVVSDESRRGMKLLVAYDRETSGEPATRTKQRDGANR